MCPHALFSQARSHIPKEHFPDCSYLLKASVLDVHGAVKMYVLLSILLMVMFPFSLQKFVLWCQWVVAHGHCAAQKIQCSESCVLWYYHNCCYYLPFTMVCLILSNIYKEQNSGRYSICIIEIASHFSHWGAECYYVSTWAVVVVHGQCTEQLTVCNLFCIVTTTGIMVLSLSCHFIMLWLIAEQLCGEQSAKCQPKIWIAWYVFIVLRVLYFCFKTHGSESRGQERAKRIAKNKTHDKLMCVFYTSERFRNMTYVIITVNISRLTSTFKLTL